MVTQMKSGVLFGDEVPELFAYAKREGFALPAVNVTGSSTINAALETASELRSPIIIQLSYGGSKFNAGLGLDLEGHKSAVLGAISAAKHVAVLAEYYQVPVILHTDHCDASKLSWLDGLIEAGATHFKDFGRPLFSSHMLDLSEKSLEENVATSKEYLKKISPLGMLLEVELGITGGEEDGVDHTGVEISRLYTEPEEVGYCYSELLSVSPRFIVAASFGNVHGVYQPGNVKLKPEILKHSQEYVQAKFKTDSNPIDFVFHGGSGSGLASIHEAISYGVVKINFDTDLQYAYMTGIRDYFHGKSGFLKSQVGNPEGENLPNKKYYDPRVWLREGERSFKAVLKKIFEDLKSVGVAG